MERLALRRRLLKTGAGGDDDVAFFARPDPAKKSEPFRCNLLVGQDIFHRQELGFGKEERLRQPVRQAFMQLLLDADTGANYPKRFWNFPGDNRDQKSARRLDDMREGNRTFAPPQSLQSIFDWCACRDDFEKIGAAGFFHVILSPKGDPSSICPDESDSGLAAVTRFLRITIQTFLQLASDGLGHGSYAINQIGEHFRLEGLFAVAPRLLGIVVDFDHECIGPSRDRGE